MANLPVLKLETPINDPSLTRCLFNSGLKFIPVMFLFKKKKKKKNGYTDARMCSMQLLLTDKHY